MNKAFICVYRHIEFSNNRRKKTETAAQETPILYKFLETYEDNFYDWGDDPSFFAATEFNGNVKFATWGVCRRDVRRQLNKNDLIIFFCGKEKNKSWDYYFTGYGTVKDTLFDRLLIWKDDKYKKYRNYFNLLIDKNDKHREPFGGNHDNYIKRKEAPYIFFDTNPEKTNFNLINPLKVASYDPRIDETEAWAIGDKLVDRLETLLLKKHFNTSRKLRSTHGQMPHRHIRLKANKKTLNELGSKLFEMAEMAKTR